MKRVILAVAFAGWLAGCADTRTTNTGLGSTGAALDSSGSGINQERSKSATVGTNSTDNATSGAGRE